MAIPAQFPTKPVMPSQEDTSKMNDTEKAAAGQRFDKNMIEYQDALSRYNRMIEMISNESKRNDEALRTVINNMK